MAPVSMFAIVQGQFCRNDGCSYDEVLSASNDDWLRSARGAGCRSGD